MTNKFTARASKFGLHRVPVRVAAFAMATVLCATGVVIVATAPNASAGTAPVQFGYVPMPADQFQLVMEHVNSAADTTLDFTVGITSAAAGAIITYDHWEDGYEADLANPVQSTTQVWGDGNAANGDASTVCSVCTGDLIPQGAVIVGRNSITTPRNPAQIRYDGRDEVASTRGFALTAGGFSTPLGSVLAGSVSAFDTSTYGTDYVVPVGENTPTPSGTSPAFEYTGAVVMAAQDATTVHVDLDGNGTDDQTTTINRGQVVFVDGGLHEGAHITSDKPVQVHLATGDVGASYESRWFTLFPTPLLTSDYLSPVGSSNNNERTIIYLFNPNASAITITPTCTSCSGTLNVPAHASISFATPLGEAVRFASSGSEHFLGIGGAGSQSGAAPGSSGDGSATHDWGFTLIPTRLLTTQAVLGWAPGNSSNPPASAGAGDEGDNPVWITTLTPTTLHVDYDGDPSTGAITGSDCFGGHHDADISVGALASTRIVDLSDSDMTGARIYTCDSTKIAGAWGEDPATAPGGSPGFDAGYTLIPSTTMIVDKSASVLTDANGDGRAGPGDTLTYDVSIADAGSLAFTNVSVDDAVPAGTSYVAGSTVFDDGSTTTPIADSSGPSTPFPLDEGGASIPNISAGLTVHVRYRLHIDNPFNAGGSSVTNSATVTADEATASDTNVVQLATADLSLTKTQTASPVYVGDNAVWHLTVANAGPDTATGVEVTDLLPPDTTYVSDNPSQGTYDNSTGLWSVGSLASGATATIDITSTVDDTSVTNYAEITASDAIDPDSQPAENPLDNTHAPDQDDEGSATVTVTSTSAGALGDTVWFDRNADGRRNAGEPGIAGVGVFVRWAGPDATFGTGDDVVTHTMTDANGSWNVSGLSAGHYRVKIDAATLPVDERIPTHDLDGVATADRADLTLATNQVRTDADFGYRRAATGGDTVFNDANGNNIADPGEGLAGIEVTVTEAGRDGKLGTHDDVARIATTDAGGVWSVHGLPAGLVRVRVNQASLPGGLVNTSDPDGRNDSESRVVLKAGTTDLAQDFAYSAPAMFGDHVWLDRNGNGVADPGEAGVPGVTVTLMRDGDHDGVYETTIGTTTSDANGNYAFANLRYGDYCVVVDAATAPNGAALTTPDHVDADLAPGEVSLLGDFGLAPSVLPFTGAAPGWLIRIALMLVAVGGALTFAARRRRRPSPTTRSA